MRLSGVFYTYYLIHEPVGVGAPAGFLFFMKNVATLGGNRDSQLL